MRRVLAAFQKAMWFLVSAVVVVAGIEAIIYIPFYGSAKAGLAVNSTDFITIVLAAVAVILTALAIILAVAGVVGYTQIRDQALTTAKDTAHKAATDRVDELLPRPVLRFMKQQVAMPNEIDSDAIAKAQSESTDGEG